MKESIICSLPMFVCLFWAVFLLTRYFEGHKRAIGRLAIFMVVASVLYAGHYVFFLRLSSMLPLMDVLYVFANLSVYPLYFLYVEELTVGRKIYGVGHWLLVLPPPLIAMCTWFAYHAMTPEQTSLFIERYLYGNSWEQLSGTTYVQAVIHTVARVVFALQIIPILYFGNRNIQHFEHKLESVYSGQESKEVRPLQFLLWLFAITAFFSFVSNIIGRQQFAHSPSLLVIPSFLFSFFLYYIGYVGYRQKITIHDIERERSEIAALLPEPSVVEAEATELQKLQTENVEPEQAVASVSNGLRQRIEKLMHDEQLYLQPNLKISDLAQQLGSNRNYIYNAINVEMGLSFSDYVNGMRVEHAQQLMRQQPDLLLSEVAVNSGFSSTVSFYRAFKKFAGCAPKDWRP